MQLVPRHWKQLAYTQSTVFTPITRKKIGQWKRSEAPIETAHLIPPGVEYWVYVENDKEQQ